MLELAAGFQLAHEASDDVVQLDERVLVGVAGRRGPEEALERVVVEVGAARAVIEEPRLGRAGHAADEAGRVVAPHVVEAREDGDGDLLHVLGGSAARRVHEALVEGHVAHPLRARLGVDDLREEGGVAPLAVHVRHRQEAVEVVEAHVLRLRLHVLAEVPLAHGLRGVAAVGEELGQRHLALESARLAVHRRALQPVAPRQAAREQRAPRRRARGLRVARREPEAAPGEGVDRRGGRAHRDAAPVAAEVAPAHVVEEDHQDVRPAPRAGGVRGELLPRRLRLVGEDEGRFAMRGEADGRARNRIEGRHAETICGGGGNFKTRARQGPCR